MKSQAPAPKAISTISELSSQSSQTSRPESMPPFQSDDIPEALRDSAAGRSPSSLSHPPFPLVWVVTIGIGAIALGATTALLWPFMMKALNRQGFFSQDGSHQSGALLTSQPDLTSPFQTDELPGEQESSPSDSADPNADTLLGHRAYEEAPEEDLVPVMGDASIRLRSIAAEHFADMSWAAQTDGIRLQPLSGFRTEEDQEYLFFEIKKNRRQSSLERATVSAPPGYSEHHTGYAIDIGDPARPETHLDERFSETETFEWLQEHASAYGFELSFHGKVDEIVSYEPWHWRFVGDRHSLETFYGENHNPQRPSTRDRLLEAQEFDEQYSDR